VDDQIKQLEGLRDNVDMREMFSSVRDLPQEERMEKIRQLAEEATKKVQAQVDEILLPHQAKRLKQLNYQLQMQGGLTRAIRSEELRKELNITEQQREQLEAKSEEIEERTRKQLAEIRKKAQEELLGTLTPEQRAKVNALVGEPFEFQQPEFGRMGGFPGGPGGAGGPGGPGGGPGGDRGDRGTRRGGR